MYVLLFAVSFLRCTCNHFYTFNKILFPCPLFFPFHGSTILRFLQSWKKSHGNWKYSEKIMEFLYRLSRIMHTSSDMSYRNFLCAWFVISGTEIIMWLGYGRLGLCSRFHIVYYYITVYAGGKPSFRLRIFSLETRFYFLFANVMLSLPSWHLTK